MNAVQLSRAIREKAEAINEREEKREDDRDTAELLNVLARLIEGKPLGKAFGAPGDWGYSNPIGKALAASPRGRCTDCGCEISADSEVVTIKVPAGLCGECACEEE
jgi:hypothetical protein